MFVKLATLANDEACKIWIQGILKLSQVKQKAKATLKDTRGQGTVEYAILVGVLVVIAIIAVIAFKPKIDELWSKIRDNINGL